MTAADGSCGVVMLRGCHANRSGVRNSTKLYRGEGERERKKEREEGRRREGGRERKVTYCPFIWHVLISIVHVHHLLILRCAYLAIISSPIRNRGCHFIGQLLTLMPVVEYVCLFVCSCADSSSVSRFSNVFYCE